MVKKMEIREVQHSSITKISSNTLTAEHTEYLKLALKTANGRRLGIDFSSVKKVKNDFLEFIKQNVQKGELSFYNVNEELYVLFFIMRMDRYLNFYISENDFVNNKQCIANRHLRLCS